MNRGLTARWRGSRAFSLIELIVTLWILAILLGLSVPLVSKTVKREREYELKRSLRELRQAIDYYKAASDAGRIEVQLDTEGYPPDLETLVDGVEAIGDATGATLKFLRRVPLDPVTNSTDWGLRSYQDDPQTGSWGGQNVFDVYCISDEVALDGSLYRDW
ncbi:MAG TPA: prepilin-type N-terminal cleavage/methylation domain-containing protein [Terriglobia bacterium]|nr:prepilin-type N-terminal cleavage/methylation domain-containing protein [Terriglobia bacterium]